MAEGLENNNGSNIQRINNVKSFEEAIQIAMEDGKFDEEELKQILSLYNNKSQELYDLYIQGTCETEDKTKCELNDLKMETKLLSLAMVDSEIIFSNIEKIINKPYIKRFLLELAKYSSFLTIIYIGKYKAQPWAKDVLFEAIKRDPYDAFIHFNKYQSEFWAKDILVEVTKKNPYLAFTYFDVYKHEPWAKDILLIARNRESLIGATKIAPFSAFNGYDKYKDEPWAKDIIIEATKKEPYSAFTYYDKYKNEPWAKEIIKLAIQEINNKQEKDYLKIAYIINVLHNEDDKLRFAIVDSYSSRELYKVITKGREEVFTSTYNGIITRFIAELNKTGKDVYDVAQENNFENISVFLEAAASYGRIEELLNTIKSDEKKKELINHMFENLGNDLVRNSVAIMEIMA